MATDCSLCRKGSRRRPVPLKPLDGTVLVEGLLKNDHWTGGQPPLDVIEATGQIYCPSAVGVAAVAEYLATDPGSYCKPRAHLFVHRMPIGSVIALPVLDAHAADGYETDETGAEYEFELREALLVRITSDVKAGPMKGRSFLRDATYCSLGHTPLHPGCWQCRASIRRLLLNKDLATAAAAAKKLEKKLPSHFGEPTCVAEDFVALHRDVEVLGRIRHGGCEDPHYFEWNYGSIKCTQTRVYAASIQR
jgi:hypothetical protein